MIRVRGGRGLGDAIYLRPIAEHFVREGQATTVLSDHADVFIGSGAKVEPFQRTGHNVVAHYVARKEQPGTTQWEDVCISAGVSVPLRITWQARNPKLIDRLCAKAAGRPIVVVHGGRMPMGRADGFGIELMPRKEAFDVVLAALGDDCLTVQIGKAPQLYGLRTEVDLNGSTSVADLLDLAQLCEAVIAQCSFAVPLAEVFDKPLLAIWSDRAAKSKNSFIRATTPQKVLSAPRDRFIVDNWEESVMREEARALCGLL